LFPPKDVLLQVLSEAVSKGLRLGTTQLVKLVYLSEVEYYRVTGERLTNLDWLFYHYGPYALAFSEMFDSPEFDRVVKETQSEREFHQISFRDPSLAERSHVDVKTSLLVKRVISQWGSKPLPALLDYVYFETEPMQIVLNRGDHLDFTSIKPGATKDVVPVVASKAANTKLSELRSRLSPFFAELGHQRADAEKPSENLQQALQAWDEEENHETPRTSNLRVILKQSEPNGDTKGR